MQEKLPKSKFESNTGVFLQGWLSPSHSCISNGLMAEVRIDDDLIGQKVKFHNKNIFCFSVIRQPPNRWARRMGGGQRMGRTRMGTRGGFIRVNTGIFCERCLTELRLGTFRHSIHA